RDGTAWLKLQQIAQGHGWPVFDHLHVFPPGLVVVAILDRFVQRLKNIGIESVIFPSVAIAEITCVFQFILDLRTKSSAVESQNILRDLFHADTPDARN